MIRYAGTALALVATAAVGAAPVPKDTKQNHALTLPANSPVAGFVSPGNKVDLIATIRTGNKLEAFPLVVSVLVVAVDVEVRDGQPAERMTVTVSVSEKEAKVLALAKRRGCSVEVLLRHPDKGADKGHDLDAVIEKLSAREVAPAPRLKEHK